MQEDAVSIGEIASEVALTSRSRVKVVVPGTVTSVRRRAVRRPRIRSVYVVSQCDTGPKGLWEAYGRCLKAMWAS